MAAPLSHVDVDVASAVDAVDLMRVKNATISGGTAILSECQVLEFATKMEEPREFDFCENSAELAISTTDMETKERSHYEYRHQDNTSQFVDDKVVSGEELSWGEVTEIIIKEVRKYPQLYDKAHTKYRDQTAKNFAWTQIGKLVNWKAMRVSKRWESIRSRYRSIRRHMDEESESGAATVHVPAHDSAYMASLSWLTPHLTEKHANGIHGYRNRRSKDIVMLEARTERGQVDSISTIVADHPATSSLSTTPSSSTAQSSFDVPLSSTTPVRPEISQDKSNATAHYAVPPLSKRAKRKLTSLAPAAPNLLDRVLMQLLEKRESAKRPCMDEDSVWGELVVMHVRKLNDERKAVIKMQIDQLIMSALYPGVAQLHFQPFQHMASRMPIVSQSHTQFQSYQIQQQQQQANQGGYNYQQENAT